MTSIAIIAPDGNHVTSITGNMPVKALIRAKRSDPTIERNPSIKACGDWPFLFDRIFVCGTKRWRSYAPDDLPMKHWGN